MKTRAATFVAWMRACTSGAVSREALMQAVLGDDESVEIRSAARSTLPLEEVLAAWAAESWGEPRLVLGVSGDPRGLPGPGPATSAALAAGEAVVADRVVLVPQVEAFGNPIEGFTTLTTWHLHEVSEPAVRAPSVGIGEADRELRSAMLEAVELLASMSHAQWSPELADAVDDIRTLRRDGEPFASSLPRIYSPTARELVARAVVVDRIVEIAHRDEGSLLHSGDAERRQRALGALAHAVRAAMVEAINEPHPVVQPAASRTDAARAKR